ncbi:hypothetical protein QVD17_03453 [Tagetes erecta]|uniref:Uncharacterized protein n=1 Tax=Tagetes erecta TaxID=13708 RepID=A0AAD8P9X7_TARER|nr:hypothetical protein QVD17_03453 [Tagetes erecta]
MMKTTAGRLHSPSAPHIDCNDQGVDFVEASIHSPLDEFINKKHQDETFDQLIPNALGCAGNKTSSNMTAVQLTYFTCGGAADFQPVEEKPIVKYATKRFVFTNSKLNELKKKINAMGTSPVNPTRVESLTSLLSKTLAGTGAASTKLGVVQTVNLRGKTNAMLHESGLGNLYALVSARMKDLGEHELIRSLRKDRMELQGIRDLEERV